MKRICWHWAVTAYKTTELSKKHYHFGVDGDGTIVKGKFKPEDNIPPLHSGKYAAHTSRFNSHAIGIGAAAMRGAKSETDYGNYPITEEQFDAMCALTARLCLRYNIAVTRDTVYTHAEVEEQFGKPQRGKWDIAVLPHVNMRGARKCGDYIRLKVVEALIREKALLDVNKNTEKKIVKENTPLKPKKKFPKKTTGAVVVGVTAVTFWDKIQNFFQGLFG